MRSKLVPTVAVLILVALAPGHAQIPAASAPAKSRDFELISVNNAGNQGNNDSEVAVVSSDGRFVAFSSGADNLVPGDTNLFYDVFVRDRLTHTTERVSVGTGGVQSDGDSGFLNLMGSPAISDNGRFVAFSSMAANFGFVDNNGNPEVFVHDRRTGVTTLISVGLDGAAAGGIEPSISADGRFVAFSSSGDTLVPGDTNFAQDIFVRDRRTGTNERVSVASNGTQASQMSFGSAISGNGRFVAFNSFADDLVPGDVDGALDVFVHDRQTGLTEAVSSPGVGFVDRLLSSITPDGRFVGFTSAEPLLVPNDTNGFVRDAFVFDRRTDRLRLVSRNSAGVQGDDDTFSSLVSADATFVVFSSRASNLIRRDNNFAADVFRRNLGTGRTVRVAHDRPTSQTPAFDVAATALTPDARFVALVTRADLLPEQDVGFFADDVYLLDLGGMCSENADGDLQSQGQCQ